MRAMPEANLEFGKRLAMIHKGHISQTNASSRVSRFIFYSLPSFYVV